MSIRNSLTSRRSEIFSSASKPDVRGFREFVLRRFLAAREYYAEHAFLCNCIIVVLVALVPFSWGKGPFLLESGNADFSFPLDPVRAFRGLLFAFDAPTDNLQFTVIVRSGAFLFPYVAFLAALSSTGIQLHLVQTVFFVFMLSFPGVSMSYFSSRVRKGNGLPEMQLICSLFYMLNPYVVAMWQAWWLPHFFAYSTLPLILGLVETISLEPERRFLRGAEIAIASSLMGTSMAWPPVCFIAWAIIVFYSLASLKRLGFRFAVETILIILVLGGLANAWWVLPFLGLSPGALAQLATTAFTARGLPSFDKYIAFEISLNSSATTLVNVIRLFGYWPWFSVSPGSYYFAYYGSVGLLLASLSFPVLAFLSIMKPRRRTYTLLATALIGIFLAKGVRPPLGEANYFLYTKVPYGFAFVDNFQDFTILIALSYSILTGDAYHALCHLASKRLRVRTFSTIIIILLVSANAYPLLLNEWPDRFSQDPNISELFADTGLKYAVPSYYSDLRNWLAAQPQDFKVLPLPETGLYELSQWGYFGPDFLRYFTGFTPLTFKTLTGVGTSEQTLIQNLFRQLDTDTSGRWVDFARELHIRYIILDNSLIPLEGAADQGELRQIIGKSSEVKHLRSFGSLEVYEIDHYIPIVYSPQKVVVLSTNFTDPRRLFATSTTALVLEGSGDQAIFGKLSRVSSATVLAYERRDPVTFEVRVSSPGSFLLVLGVPYSGLWVATVGDKQVQIHIMVNGFANAWFIEDSGMLSVIIRNVGQDRVTYGVLVSMLSILSMIVFILVQIRRIETSKKE